MFSDCYIVSPNFGKSSWQNPQWVAKWTPSRRLGWWVHSEEMGGCGHPPIKGKELNWRKEPEPGQCFSWPGPSMLCMKIKNLFVKSVYDRQLIHKITKSAL